MDPPVVPHRGVGGRPRSAPNSGEEVDVSSSDAMVLESTWPASTCCTATTVASPSWHVFDGLICHRIGSNALCGHSCQQIWMDIIT
ncbi:unnamed protein product [Urochloa humidicola]